MTLPAAPYVYVSENIPIDSSRQFRPVGDPFMVIGGDLSRDKLLIDRHGDTKIVIGTLVRFDDRVVPGAEQFRISDIDLIGSTLEIRVCSFHRYCCPPVLFPFSGETVPSHQKIWEQFAQFLQGHLLEVVWESKGKLFSQQTHGHFQSVVDACFSEVKKCYPYEFEEVERIRVAMESSVFNAVIAYVSLDFIMKNFPNWRYCYGLSKETTSHSKSSPFVDHKSFWKLPETGRR